MQRGHGETGVIRFGAFALDTNAGELRKGCTRLRLPHQSIEILVALLDEPGAVVSREELRLRLWPADTFVDFEHGVNAAVRRLRAALGDSADSPRFIETLPRRGYRFIGRIEAPAPAGMAAAAASMTAPPSWRATPARLATAVPPAAAEANEANGAANPDPEDSSAALDAGAAGPIALAVRVGVIAPPFAAASTTAARPRRRVLMSAALVAVVAGVLVASLGAAAWRSRARGGGISAIRSIAVLPLQNLSRDPEQEFFSDGTTDALISSLAQIHSLDVTSRTSVMRYKGTTKPLRDIARELGVDAIVEGTVQREGGRVRIATQLIRTATDTDLWADTFDGDAADLLRLQSEAARAVAAAIHARITPAEARRLGTAAPVDARVEEALLLGQYHYHRNNAADLREAIRYFEQALAMLPGYAPALAALSEARQSLDNFEPQPEPAMQTPAEEAVRADPDLAAAHSALARMRFHDWDWAAADREFKRAYALNSAGIDECACYALFLAATGRFDEALAISDHGLKVNPLSADMHANRALVSYSAHRFDDAILHAQRALELDSENGVARYYLELSYVASGRAAQALSVMDSPPPAPPLWHALAYAWSGRAADARAVLAHAADDDAALLRAGAYVPLGDVDTMVGWVAKAIEHRESAVRWVGVDPIFDSVRANPRFRAVVAQMHLPVY